MVLYSTKRPFLAVLLAEMGLQFAALVDPFDSRPGGGRAAGGLEGAEVGDYRVVVFNVNVGGD